MSDRMHVVVNCELLLLLVQCYCYSCYCCWCCSYRCRLYLVLLVLSSNSPVHRTVNNCATSCDYANMRRIAHMLICMQTDSEQVDSVMVATKKYKNNLFCIEYHQPNGTNALLCTLLFLLDITTSLYAYRWISIPSSLMISLVAVSFEWWSSSFYLCWQRWSVSWIQLHTMVAIQLTTHYYSSLNLTWLKLLSWLATHTHISELDCIWSTYLDSSGLSKRKRSKKLSSRGSSCASWG